MNYKIGTDAPELVDLMEQTGATIETSDTLPKIHADPDLIKQLLQS